MYDGKRLQFILPLEDCAFGRATFIVVKIVLNVFPQINLSRHFLYARGDNGKNCAIGRKTLK